MCVIRWIHQLAKTDPQVGEDDHEIDQDDDPFVPEDKVAYRGEVTAPTQIFGFQKQVRRD